MSSAWVFGPNPLRVMSRFSLQAYNSSPRDSTPRSFQMTRIFPGPNPLIWSISSMPAGTWDLCFSRVAILPVSTNSLILDAMAFPTPLMDWISSSDISAKGSPNFLKLI